MINSDYEEYSEDDEKYSEYDGPDNDEGKSEDNDDRKSEDNDEEKSEDNDEEKSEEEYEEESEEEYEDELNYKKQILKSFYNYLEFVIKSIDDKKHNKKTINKLYYIIDKYYKDNYNKDIESQVNLKKKESNIFESFINKTIDINKRLIKAEDNTNSILILNNFITKTLIY